jgi:DNA primase
MASDGTAEEVKSRLDIVEHISDYVQLKRSGANYKGLCPFHNEKSPSFMVHPAKQIFHCFGCNAGGDVFTFTMKHEGLNFPEALALLARKAGVEIKRQSGYKKGERENLKGALTEAMAFFRQELKTSTVAQKYIKERGLTPEMVKEFQVGYAPKGWHNLLNHMKKKGFREEIIIKAGLANKGDRGLYDMFRARLIFPILDMHGEVVAFGGRIIEDGQPKYLNSPDSPLFKKGETLYALSNSRDAIRNKGFVAVCEGYLDAIMCHQYGIKNVVAPLGTALTLGHLKKLFRNAEDIVLLFDGDSAGVAAARRSLDLIMEQNMRARVLMLPEGEDPDSILRKEGSEKMLERMKNASSPVGFILDTQEGPKGINDSVVLIARAADPILRDELLIELSDRTRISEAAIRDKLSRFKKTGSASSPRTQPRAHNEETLLLSVAIIEPHLATELMKRIEIDTLNDPVISVLLKRLAENSEQVGSDMLSFAESDDERVLISKFTLDPGFEPDDLRAVFEDCIKKISRKGIDREIADAERSGNFEKFNELIGKRKALLQEP